jgi:hypothetical protein
MSMELQAYFPPHPHESPTLLESVEQPPHALTGPPSQGAAIAPDELAPDEPPPEEPPPFEAPPDEPAPDEAPAPEDAPEDAAPDEPPPPCPPSSVLSASPSPVCPVASGHTTFDPVFPESSDDPMSVPCEPDPPQAATCAPTSSSPAVSPGARHERSLPGSASPATRLET